jgi:hypothetical protein
MANQRLREDQDGALILKPDAVAIAAQNSTGANALAKPAVLVDYEAKKKCLEAGLNPSDAPTRLSFSTIQFGQYQGKTFRWLFEHDLGWVIYFLARYGEERPSLQLEKASSFTANREALFTYAQSFPKVVDEISRRQKLNKQEKTAAQAGDMSSCLVNFGKFKDKTWGEMLEAKSTDLQNYKRNFLLNPSTKVRHGSRMEQLVEWLKKQQGIS